MSFRETNIWQSTLAARVNDSHALPRERLRTAYENLWDNACELARQIAVDLPSLTLHDERHFNALWHRADQILGSSDVLTPVEGFVLGAAILLHDAANTLAAYPDRLLTIKATNEWRDEVAQRIRTNEDVELSEDDIQGAPEEVQKAALFSTLRQLHAKRAEGLANLEFRPSGSSQSVRLFPDDRLRIHLGRVIGLIAASHHWDIQTLPDRLPRILGVMAGFPHSWTVRPIRVACLLRCADALQIDQERVPDFLFAMLDLMGVSEAHWRAQNRLLAPVNDPDDEAALIITSSQDFGPDDADAWWIAYEAINAANRELSESYALLRDLRQKPFTIARIRNAESPARLANDNVAVRGWRPVNAEVKISSVANVVKMFGGEQLYGSDFLVPLRELIQNAVDAIRRRRELPNETTYSGEITVRISKQDNDYILSVDDDGIGMSEAVLTGPLIDFGSSYFGSQLAKAERPGMLARAARRAGRFGVGFFSIFMIAKQADITSRPFDQGIADANTLRFINGFSLRPLLMQPVQPLSSLTSTSVTLRLDQRTFDSMMEFSLQWDEKITLTLADAVSLCAPMADCDIYCQAFDQERALVHGRYWMDEDRWDWLRRVLVLKHDDERSRRASNAARAVPNLRFVDENDPSAGLAAINVDYVYLGIPTSGGFKATANRRAGTGLEMEFTGCIEFVPAGPRRAHAWHEKDSATAAWATEQALILSKMDLPDDEAIQSAEFVIEYRGDPAPLLRARVNRRRMCIPEVAAELERGPVFAALQTSHGPDDWMIGRLEIGPEEVRYCPKDDELRLKLTVLETSLVLEAYGEVHRVGPENGPFPAGSLLHCLERYLLKNGKKLTVTPALGLVVGSYIGPPSERDQIMSGCDVRQDCLKLEIDAD